MPTLNFDVNASIIIPAFYRKNVLLHKQYIFFKTYQNFKLIVVDDGSTEDFTEIIETSAKNEHIFFSTKKYRRCFSEEFWCFDCEWEIG